MSEPTALLDEVTRSGIELRAVGDRLRFRPVNRVTPELLARLREHKPELLAILRDRQGVVTRPATLDRANLAARAAHAESGRVSVPGDYSHGFQAGAQWLDGEALSKLAEALQGLVCPRDGWTPEGWARYLRYRAGRCDDQHADIAARYEQACRLLWGVEEPTIDST